MNKNLNFDPQKSAAWFASSNGHHIVMQWHEVDELVDLWAKATFESEAVYAYCTRAIYNDNHVDIAVENLDKSDMRTLNHMRLNYEGTDSYAIRKGPHQELGIAMSEAVFKDLFEQMGITDAHDRFLQTLGTNTHVYFIFTGTEPLIENQSEPQAVPTLPTPHVSEETPLGKLIAYPLHPADDGEAPASAPGIHVELVDKQGTHHLLTAVSCIPDGQCNYHELHTYSYPYVGSTDAIRTVHELPIPKDEQELEIQFSKSIFLKSEDVQTLLGKWARKEFGVHVDAYADGHENGSRAWIRVTDLRYEDNTAVRDWFVRYYPDRLLEPYVPILHIPADIALDIFSEILHDAPFNMEKVEDTSVTAYGIHFHEKKS